MKIGHYHNIYGLNKIPVLNIKDIEYDDFVKEFENPVVGEKYGAYFIRGGELKENVRKDENLLSAEFVIIDADSSIDNPESAPDPELVHKALKDDNITHLIYPSYSNDPPNKNRYRVVIPAKLKNKDELTKCVNWVIAFLNIKNIPIKDVKENHTWSQPWFYPALREADQDYSIYKYNGDRLIPSDVPDSYLKADSVNDTTKTQSDDSTYYKDAIKEILSGGAGHTNIIKFGNACARNGTPKTTCINMLEVIIDQAKWDQEKKDERKATLQKFIGDCYDNIGTHDTDNDLVFDGYGDNQSVEEADLDTLPDSILMPPDKLIGQLAIALKKTWWAPNSMIASLAARSVVAYLAGGNFMGQLQDRVNIQQCAVGISGCGKDLLVSSVSDVIQNAFMDDLILVKKLVHGVIEEAASAEGLDDRLRSLGEKHDAIFVKDEMGGLMKQATSGNQFKAGVFQYFLRMYTKAGKISNERAKAKGKDVVEGTTLYAPNFIVSGATTPDLITNGLNSDFVATGVMSRLMLFNASNYRENPVRKIEPLDLPYDIVVNLKKMADSSLLETKAFKMPAARVYSPKIVKFNDDVIDYCYEQSVKDHNRKHNLEIWNRRVPNAKKYALCEAILECPENPIVDLDNIKRQMKFIESSCQFTIGLFSDSVGDSDTDLISKAIMKRANLKRGVWVKRGFIVNCKAASKADPRLLNSVIENLVESEFLDFKSVSNKRGKPTKLFRAGNR